MPILAPLTNSEGDFIGPSRFLENHRGRCCYAATLSNRGIVAAVTPALAAGRTVLPINRGWKYRATATPAAHEAGSSEASFIRVNVPHTNKALPWHGFDDKVYEFTISAYRRSIGVPASAHGKRVFVDFEGVMLASTVYINGKRLGEYRGGYTPFCFELTGHLNPSGVNLLSLDVDSTERKDVPPGGNEVDYLTFGGIYREVALRIVPQIFIENIHAKTKDVLTPNPSVEVEVYLDRSEAANPGVLSVLAELRDGDRVIAHGTGRITTPPVKQHSPADADQAIGARRLMTPALDAPTAVVTLSSFSECD